jgi:general secretion pathway protein F
MTIIGIGILSLLMTVVVPKVTKIFESMKVTLPWTTRLLIFTSNAFADFWWIIFPVAIGAVVLFLRWKASPKGRPVWDRFVLRAPCSGAWCGCWPSPGSAGRWPPSSGAASRCSRRWTSPRT